MLGVACVSLYSRKEDQRQVKEQNKWIVVRTTSEASLPRDSRWRGKSKVRCTWCGVNLRLQCVESSEMFFISFHSITKASLCTFSRHSDWCLCLWNAALPVRKSYRMEDICLARGLIGQAWFISESIRGSSWSCLFQGLFSRSLRCHSKSAMINFSGVYKGYRRDEVRYSLVLFVHFNVCQMYKIQALDTADLQESKISKKRYNGGTRNQIPPKIRHGELRSISARSPKISKQTLSSTPKYPTQSKVLRNIH